MRAALPLLVAVLSAAGTRWASGNLDDGDRSRELAKHETTSRLNRIVERQGNLSKRLADVESDLGRTTQASLPKPEPEATVVTDRDVEGALDRWLSAHGLEAEALTGTLSLPAGAAVPDKSPLADLPVEDVFALLADLGPFTPASEALYTELRDAGRLDELLQVLEADAHAHPEDSELQLRLGTTYLQALFGVGPSPEAGLLATQADEAFDRALEADPENLEARYIKAVSLSNWPPFLGKSGQAIEQFEILIGELEADGSKQGFVDSYLYLGNLYEQSGDLERAIEAWRSGLLVDPENEELLARLAETGG